MPRPARRRGLAARSALIVFVSLLLTPPVQGGDAPDIRYLGLQGGRAKLAIQRRSYVTLKIGELDKSGIKLLSVSKQAAVVRYQGTNYRYKKGSPSGKALPHTVAIEHNSNKMFLTRGTIDGVAVDFIVDTGASHVVISADRARKLRLRYDRRNPIKVVTASRTETAYQVTIASVSVGGIYKNEVKALVTRGKFPSTVLLGMSFLGSLQMRQEGNRLVLTD